MYMNWNYIAGFFDGEGTVSKSGYRHRITVTQTNKEVLEKIRLFTCRGSISVIKKRKPHWKDAWIYYVSDQKDVYFFLNKIIDKLIVKKTIVSKVLPKIKDRIKYREQQKKKIVKRKKIAKILRKKGLSYRQIGKKLNIDWGYARRLILDLK